MNSVNDYEIKGQAHHDSRLVPSYLHTIVNNVFRTVSYNSDSTNDFKFFMGLDLM